MKRNKILTVIIALVISALALTACGRKVGILRELGR